MFKADVSKYLAVYSLQKILGFLTSLSNLLNLHLLIFIFVHNSTIRFLVILLINFLEVYC